jgi:hypothetical protein
MGHDMSKYITSSLSNLWILYNDFIPILIHTHNKSAAQTSLLLPLLATLFVTRICDQESANPFQYLASTSTA